VGRLGRRDSPQTYTSEEDVFVNKVHAAKLEWEHFEEPESPDNLVKTGKIFTTGSSSGVGRATVTVDASVEECAAWEIAVTSRERIKTAESLERSRRQRSQLHGEGRLRPQNPRLHVERIVSRNIWRWGQLFPRTWITRTPHAVAC